MKTLLSVAILSSFLLAGCLHEPTLDTTSDDALKASVEKVAANLSPDEKAQLGKAIVSAMLQGAFQGGSRISLDSLNGLTGAEAIALVNKATSQKNADNRSELLAEIEVLKIEREEIKAELQPFTVSDVSYKWDDGFINEPIVSYTITNGGNQALGGIYIRSTIKSPGRSKAWSVDDSPSGIDGGLEPGESREFSTFDFSSSVRWKKLGLFGSTDLEVTVEVIGIETVEEDRPDGMYHGSNITRIDDRLRDLEERAAKLSG
jgi:hypothetical protein